ncbi:MAG: membrane dipeptidase [Oscillospiraceae bacterium]|nr:membrane dipeptidase [Oscillospiraceae bacterium]
MKKIPYFDAHCDTLLRCRQNGWHLSENPGHVDLRRAGCFSAYAQFFAIYYDSAVPLSGSHFAETAAYRALLMQELAGQATQFCSSRRDVEAAAAAGKPAALLSVEGGELLDCDPANLETAADWGVQMLNLTWNHKNLLSGTNCQEPERGLSILGREFVREAQRLHILMDVSHVSERGFWDLCEITEQPIVASHSNSKAICDHSRNLTDEQFRAIAQSGGVAGLNLYANFIGGEADFPMLIRHLEHFLDLGGEDAVGLGGDLDGCETLCRGIGGIQDVPQLYAALEARGYGEALLHKIFWGNWLRVIRPGT